MNDVASLLVKDLRERLHFLCSTHDRPAYFVSEHFYEIRNEIDYDAERALQMIQKDMKEEEASAKINNQRDELIRILKDIEKRLLGDTSVPTTSSFQAFASLNARINEFTNAAANSIRDMNELEDTYTLLALEAIDETHKLEEKLLGNQTIVYIPSIGEDQIGHLIYLAGAFLRREEIGALKSRKDANFTLQDVYDGVEISRNKSMVVRVTKPFTVSKNLALVYAILKLIVPQTQPETKLICYEMSDALSSSMPEFVLQLSVANFMELESLPNLSIDAFDASMVSLRELFAELESLDLSDNRLKSLDLKWLSLPENLIDLNIDSNQLESLDHDFISKCVNLKTLSMVKSCLPETKLGLEFLEPIHLLNTLEITLPDIPLDFSAFKNLDFLKNVTINSVASNDLNRQYPKLTRDHFKQLSAAKSIGRLTLAFFEIDKFDQEIFKRFGALFSLFLTNCRVNHIDENTFLECPNRFHFINLQQCQLAGFSASLFTCDGLDELKLGMNSIRILEENCFSHLIKLTKLVLKHNRISDLPAGIFDQLASLRLLSLSFNNISRINCGVFDQLGSLTSLDLSGNPIEVVETGSLSGLKKLEELSLEKCKLTSINNEMLEGLQCLHILRLNDNKIECIKVMTGNEVITINSANLSNEQFTIVKEKLFYELSRLHTLNLSNNQFKKLDLNVFCNLSNLNELYLLNNKLDELNQQIREGVLENLALITLAENQLTSISKNAFSQSTALLELNLSDNKLSSLDERFFEPFSNLTYIDIHNNSLSMLVTQTTFTCENIKEIEMSENLMIKIENGAFQGFPYLRRVRIDLPEYFTGLPEFDHIRQDDEFYDYVGECELFLKKSDPQTLQNFIANQDNQLSLSRTHRFSMVQSSLETLDGFELGRRFTSLVDLDLSKNQFKTIESSWLADMPNLTGLDFSSNLIESLDDSAVFQSLSKLRDINLSNNKLSHINRRIFSGHYELCTIDLSNNALRDIDVGLFRGLGKVREIKLGGNSITFVNLGKLLAPCRLLQTISLSGNNLDQRTINEVSLNFLTHLKELELANCGLESIEFLKVLPELRNLDLSRNRIKSLGENGQNYLGRLLSLNHLDLSGNQLPYLDVGMFAHLKEKLHYLNVSNNPFQQKDELTETFKWVSSFIFCDNQL